MKKLPEQLLQSLEGIPGFERESFERVHYAEEQVTSIRINPEKQSRNFAGSVPVPWCAYGFYLKERPSFTFDPFFHAGCYYVQEASSMFLEQALKQQTVLSHPLKVLVLCGAPGGKATHLQTLISKESLLVTNEVIKSRTPVLTDNLIKWGSRNTVVTSNDPSAFGKTGPWFDVLVVDAPCSGSGLFRRDEQAISEWSLNNVQLCYQRQQRILAGALPCLKENGLLIYSTCSYSREEDEGIMDWLIEEWQMESCRINVQPEWNITESVSSAAFGYRFYPDKVKGEGFFLSCFRKKNEGERVKIRSQSADRITARERAVLLPWLKEDAWEITRLQEQFIALPAQLFSDFSILHSVLNIRYAGTAIGQIMKDRLVPHHALALSSLVSDQIPSCALDPEQAIRYLQRAELKLETKEKGWQLVHHGGYNLGWINVLPNRINNYYPKELRILKQQNGPFEKL